MSICKHEKAQAKYGIVRVRYSKCPDCGSDCNAQFTPARAPADPFLAASATSPFWYGPAADPKPEEPTTKSQQPNPELILELPHMRIYTDRDRELAIAKGRSALMTRYNWPQCSLHKTQKTRWFVIHTSNKNGIEIYLDCEYCHREFLANEQL